ncbi:PAX-interacting protein 1-like isoform X1 [Lytechinus variegatus]|uniref:PAX-interacting protein 1-like isoform X1 n=1 Tax=Lytechinus variegatus TaxID=7654 RepID=UPI001BB2AFB3|nr:PAX-interacting protein 1-like isoform X1 [Lytechinus variegatus]
MENAMVDPENALVHLEFFKDVHYYLIGTISEEVTDLLVQGGGKEESYLTDRVTHVISEDEDHPEVTEARDLFELPVVSSKWVSMSVRCKTLLPGKAFAPESVRLFTNSIVCFSKVSTTDRNALWALITFHGGTCRANLSKGCTHLVTSKCEGAKYECASQHETQVKIVCPDWILSSVLAKKLQDEKTFHPKYLTFQTPPTEGALCQDIEMKTEEVDKVEPAEEGDDKTAKEKKEKVARPKLKLPWADDLMPLPDISALPEPLRDAPPSGSTATSSAMSSSPALGASYNTSSTGYSTPSSKTKDKKHKKDKKKKKKHKKEKKKKDKKKHKHANESGATGLGLPKEGAGGSNLDQGMKNRNMLRNITNKTDYLPSMIGVTGDKTHVSQQVLNAVGGRPGGHKGRLDQSYGSLQVIPEIHYYGHDASAGVTPDSCLLGCIFLIIEYPHLVGLDYIDTWRKVIVEHGGIVDDCYSDRITHIMCDTQRTDIFRLAMKDGKRCVTASWLNDCLKKKAMLPPWRALHFPAPSYPLQPPPCKDQIIAVTGFEGGERNDVKTMIEMTGAKYTGFFSRGNTLLICKRLEGAKYEKAQEWRTPVTNVQWLSEVILGNYDALHNFVMPRYQVFDVDDPFKLELLRPLKLMEPWTIPIKISQSIRRSYITSIAQKTANLANGKRKGDPQSPGNASKKIRNMIQMDDDWDAGTPRIAPDKAPRILFTGLDAPRMADLSKKIEKLGGRIVDTISQCTHLIAVKIMRTVKFLAGVSVCKHIVTPMWIEESYKSRWFLDVTNFSLVDQEMETLFSFQLRESLIRANKQKLFKDVTIYITPGVKPGANMLREIIECAGGKLAPSRPSLTKISHIQSALGKGAFVVISSPSDMPSCRDFFTHNIDVHNAEFVLTGVLRQQLDYKSFRFDPRI